MEIEKIMVIYMVVVFVVLMAVFTIISKGILQIREVGLKNIIEDVWEGSDNLLNPKQ